MQCGGIQKAIDLAMVIVSQHQGLNIDLFIINEAPCDMRLNNSLTRPIQFHLNPASFPTSFQETNPEYPPLAFESKPHLWLLDLEKLYTVIPCYSYFYI